MSIKKFYAVAIFSVFCVNSNAGDSIDVVEYSSNSNLVKTLKYYDSALVKVYKKINLLEKEVAILKRDLNVSKTIKSQLPIDNSNKMKHANKLLYVTPLNGDVNIRKSPAIKSNNIIGLLRFQKTIKVYSETYSPQWYRLADHEGFVNKRVVSLIKK
jgi:hypothetical protein